jgi:Na+:H+ antiporter, NhaA family
LAYLAFAEQGGIVNASKMAILIASLIAGLLGFIWLRLQGGLLVDDPNPNTMDLEEDSS